MALTGGVTGPLTGVVGPGGNNVFPAPGSWINNITTGITTDGALGGVFQSSSTTAFNIYSGVVPGGWFYSDVVRSALVVPSGTTVTGVANFGAYLINNVASTGQKSNAENYFSVAIANVDGASVWGVNTTANDSTNNVPLATSNRKLIGYEGDFTVVSNNGGTTVEGVSLELNATTAGFYGNAFQVSITGTGQWTNGLVVNDGAAQSGVIIGGLSTAAANVSSMPIKLGTYDSASTGHYMQLQAIPFGTNTGMAFVDSIRANYIYVASAAVSNAPGVLAGGTDSSINLNLFPKGPTGALKVVDNSSIATLTIGQSSVNPTNSTSGSMIVTGGVGISGNVITGGVFTAGSFVVAGAGLIFNQDTAVPTPTTTGGVIGTNFSGGSREVDFWNVDTFPANPSFAFYQLTSSVASTRLAWLTNAGAWNLAGPIAPNAPVTISASTKSQAATDAYYIVTTSSTLSPLTLILIAASTVPGQMLWIINNNPTAVVSASSNVQLLGSVGTPGTTILASTSTKYIHLVAVGSVWQAFASN